MFHRSLLGLLWLEYCFHTPTGEPQNYLHWGAQERVQRLLTQTSELASVLSNQYSATVIGEPFQIVDPILKSIVMLPSILSPNIGDHGCSECVRGVSHHIMNETEHRISQLCQTTTCEVLKIICLKASENHDVLVGFLLAKIHPHALAYLYCYGKGTCPHPFPSVLDVNSILSDATPFEATEHVQLGPHHIDAMTLFQQFMSSVSVDTLDVSAMQRETQNEPASTIDNECEASCGGNAQPSKSSPLECVCTCCIQRFTKRIMGYLTTKLLFWCMEHKTEPIPGKLCEAAYKSPGVAFGVILGIVEPYKFAYGYCAGLANCPLPVPKFPFLQTLPQEKPLQA